MVGSKHFLAQQMPNLNKVLTFVSRSIFEPTPTKPTPQSLISLLPLAANEQQEHLIECTLQPLTVPVELAIFSFADSLAIVASHTSRNP
jgi:hypothetical protein